MTREKAAGHSIILFHIFSPGQFQFIAGIHSHLCLKRQQVICYLYCEQASSTLGGDLGFDDLHCLSTMKTEELDEVNIFIQTEIYARGPQEAIRIFVGHGQPNKVTNWSSENLRAVDAYFLYGPLELEMFTEIRSHYPTDCDHIQIYEAGYPKLDDQINGRYNREQILEELKLDPSLKTVIYAPAWDPGGALSTFGTDLIDMLKQIPDINVIVKLRPASMEAPESDYFSFYTGGVNWKEELQHYNSHARVSFVEDHLINPLLFVSDLMVTDFSGVALEFMTLKRPVLFLDCPEFYEKTLVEWQQDPEKAKNDDRFNGGRNYGQVVYDIGNLASTVVHHIRNPEELSAKSQDMAQRFLYNPGKGGEVSAALILEILTSKITHHRINE
ncbi:hypothetical protein BVX99_02095 [bacterium F16]|nr:hypothetical protein BVX99_02095 [bacterium F16]